MLAEGARAVMGVPHPSGRAAMRMLETEGFRYEGYIDIFDGGPTVSAPIDQVRTVRESRLLTFAGTHETEGPATMLLGAGRLTDFAACYGRPQLGTDDKATLDAGSAAALGLEIGDSFLAVSR
jgi:arginine N-succinyltransferase